MPVPALVDAAAVVSAALSEEPPHAVRPSAERARRDTASRRMVDPFGFKMMAPGGAGKNLPIRIPDLQGRD